MRAKEGTWSVREREKRETEAQSMRATPIGGWVAAERQAGAGNQEGLGEYGRRPDAVRVREDRQREAGT